MKVLTKIVQGCVCVFDFVDVSMLLSCKKKRKKKGIDAREDH